MPLTVRPYRPADLPAMTAIWNEIVQAGLAFPQTVPLANRWEAGRPVPPTPGTDEERPAEAFFSAQTHAAVAELEGGIAGLYILHPNNVGRCGHIGNTTYAVSGACRGRGVGEALVRDSLDAARRAGFRLLQLNAVVEGNSAALQLYKKLGFTRLAAIPGGFLLPDGSYADIHPHYVELFPAGG